MNHYSATQKQQRQLKNKKDCMNLWKKPVTEFHFHCKNWHTVSCPSRHSSQPETVGKYNKGYKLYTTTAEIPPKGSLISRYQERWKTSNTSSTKVTISAPNVDITQDIQRQLMAKTWHTSPTGVAKIMQHSDKKVTSNMTNDIKCNWYKIKTYCTNWLWHKRRGGYIDDT